MGDMPLIEQIKKHVKRRPISFHTPGHKGRMPDWVLEEGIGALDLTEMHDTDNLAHPKGAILRAQEKAAAAFGAQATHFLVNGSTNGVLAMIAAAVSPGDAVIVDRACHVSLFSALIFSGARPVYVWPDILPDWGIPRGPSADSILSALKTNPKAAAVFITSPNYWGLTAETEAIAKACESTGALLLVDEAHGAHFAFHPALPKTALRCGADLCAQSAHKTLPAFTQSAMLHIGNPALAQRVAQAIRIFQTSSPSYILMAGLDFAREFMEREGEARLSALLEAISLHLKGLGALEHPGKDPTRIVLPAFGIGGYGAAKELSEKFNIEVEMAGPNYVVCVGSVFDTEEDIKALARAYGQIKTQGSWGPAPCPPRPPADRTPREAYFSPSKSVPLSKAVGMCARAALYCYPPGIPIVAPGEVITAEVLEYIAFVNEVGGQVMGICGDSVEVCLS